MAVFTFTWDSGYKTEVQIPSFSQVCGMGFSSHKASHTNAITQILSANEQQPYDENSISYITDKHAYLQEARQVLMTGQAGAVGISTFWAGKRTWCINCRGWTGLGQCNCHKKSSACYKTMSTLNAEWSGWVDVVLEWQNALAGVQILIDDVNLALEVANAQIQTLIEQQNQIAETNQVIAETNWTIAYAKGKEEEVEEEMRISKFFTILIPIVIILLIIGMIFVWRKK